MKEDWVTDQFLDAVRRLSSQGVGTLLRDGLGVSDVPEAAVWTTLGRTEWQDLSAGGAPPGGVPTVLLALTGTASLADGAPRDSTASIVDGVVAAGGELVVLFEVKLADTPLYREQLISHARAWGIPHQPLAEWDIGAPEPGGFAFRTWSDLRAWLHQQSIPGSDARVLAELAAVLARTDVRIGQAVGRQRLPPARPVTPDALPEPVSVRRILAEREPETIRKVCRELYGTTGSHRVTTVHECVRDAQAVGDAFEAAGLEPPAGLLERNGGIVGNVMTPRRLLTACYSNEPAQRMATPQSARTLRARLHGRGAGAAAILGLLAWGLNGTTPAQARAVEHLQRLWTVTPPHSHATPELLERLGNLEK